MFKKLKDLLRPKEESFKLGAINPSDYQRLKELRSHPHWDTYLKLLDRLNSFLAEDLLNASDPQAVLHYRSVILGVRRSGTIVDELIQAHEAKDARIRESDERLGRRYRDEAINAATFGTPYWG